MANSYVKSAFSIKIESQEERDFIKNLENQAEGILDSGDDSLSDFIKNQAEVSDEESLSPFEIAVYNDRNWSWDLEFSPRGDAAHFSSEDGPNTNAMVLGLQRFLQKFRPRGEKITFMWSYTSDKMRANEFSGGGVVFTSHKAYWTDVQSELKKHGEDL